MQPHGPLFNLSSLGRVLSGFLRWNDFYLTPNDEHHWSRCVMSRQRLVWLHNDPSRFRYCARCGVCVKPPDWSDSSSNTWRICTVLGGKLRSERRCRCSWALRRKTRKSQLPRESGSVRSRQRHKHVRLIDGSKGVPRVSSAPLTQLHLFLAFMCSLGFKLVFILFVLHLCAQRVCLAASPLDFAPLASW